MSDAWTTRFAEIHHPTPRGRLRHGALSAMSLAARLCGSIESALKRPRVHFVYLHHVFEDEVLPFGALVKILCETMTPISYSDGVERILSNRIDRPYVTFSFDDGFKNCLVAARVLEEFGASACFFVCPNIVGEPDRKRVITFARERLHLPPVEFMDWPDLESLIRRGHEIGNHTKSHLNLGQMRSERSEAPGGIGREQKVDDDRRMGVRPVQSDITADDASARDEIVGALELLRSRIGGVKHFAWPYGNFGAITRPARDMVFASGHRSCASGQRGAHICGAASPESFCIRRDHVIAAWPISHVLYLLARSARNASAIDNEWPAELL